MNGRTMRDGRISAVEIDSGFLQLQRSGPRRIPGEAGIWVFVLGDMTVFALFFGIIMHFRGTHPDQFAAGRATLHIVMGTVNTALLLTSSLLVAVAVHGLLQGVTASISWLLGAALGLGGGFVILKLLEWVALVRNGYTPAIGEFFEYYYVFTGIHLLHVLVGLTVLGWLTWVARTPDNLSTRLRAAENGGIYWHMVDLLWVVLYALFYLVR